MSCFSNRFNTTLAKLKLSQAAFARKSHIDYRQLNKYVRGTLDVGPAKLTQIARALPKSERGELVAAWLRDLIPDIAIDHVTILALPRADGVPPQAVQDLSPDLRDAFAHLLSEARLHTEIADVLIKLSKALRGKR